MNVLCISDWEEPVAEHFADNKWLIAERWQVRVVTALPQWRMRGWCHCCRQNWSGTVLIFWGGSRFKPFAKEGVTGATIAEGVRWGKTELMTLHGAFPITYVHLTETQQCLLSQRGFRAVGRVRCGGHLCPEVKKKTKVKSRRGRTIRELWFSWPGQRFSPSDIKSQLRLREVIKGGIQPFTWVVFQSSFFSFKSIN